MGKAAGVDEDEVVVNPTKVGVEAGIVIGDLGQRSFFKESMDFREEILRRSERLGPFLQDKVDGREVDCVGDVEAVDEHNWKGERSG